MAKIIWSEFALEDLESIYNYIAQDSIHYAHQIVNKLVERVDILEQLPEVGRKVPEFDNPIIRELIESNYRIIYRIGADDTIGIVRVHHSSRLLKSVD